MKQSNRGFDCRQKTHFVFVFLFSLSCYSLPVSEITICDLHLWFKSERL